MKAAYLNSMINQTSYSPFMYGKSVNSTKKIQDDKLQTIDLPITISFAGNLKKNTKQIASIASEYQGSLNSIYKAGGLGNVAGEAAVAFSKHGGADIRTFIPYYSPDNKNGGIKVKTPNKTEGAKAVTWKVGEGTEEGFVKEVDIDYKLKDGESFVTHDFIVGKAPTAYVELEDTGIKGSIETIKKDFSGMESVPYHMFKMKDTKPDVYVMHTPATAVFPKCYHGYHKKDNTNDLSDVAYAKTYRAVLDALPKMDNEKFDNFNPASYWLHDRQVFSILPLMAEESAKGNEYFNGLRIHNSFHNPGRGYQGHFSNPIEYLRLVGTKEDFEAIKNHPDYEFVKECERKISKLGNDYKEKTISKVLTEDEIERLYAIFDPIIGNFKDECGEYNACKIPVEGVRKNPHNITAGTVSINYGKEMKNHNSREIAYGLTSDFASIPTIDIVNGSTPANLRLGEVGDFGKGNGFEPLMEGNFTPLTEDMRKPENIDKLIEAKEKNKEFLIREIANATKKGKGSIEKLFFDEKQIKEGSSVIGGLSDYKKGDVLFIGWGRPTYQKGFPTSIEAIKQYLQSDAPEEEKLHAKFIISAGPWKTNDKEFKDIQKGMQEIAELEGGKYKGQVAYVNGFFSNRIVACSDYALITSVYEPCGITPLEAYSAGTPVISNATGGSPDFITHAYNKEGKFDEKATGMLTEHPFLVNPEVMGLRKNISDEKLNIKRREFLGKENAECIKSAMKLHDSDNYKKMASNCLGLSIDWHDNNGFNGGRSAMQRYFEDVWNIDKNLKEIQNQERNTKPLKSLKGKMELDA